MANGSLQKQWGERYLTHLKWLKNSHFIRDLERDNIDCDVIEEELNTLCEIDSPLTKRQKVVKFLRSNPIQMLLCAIVLLDASIVIVQILLDINSVKERLHKMDEQLNALVDFIQHSHPDQLSKSPINRVENRGRTRHGSQDDPVHEDIDHDHHTKSHDHHEGPQEERSNGRTKESGHDPGDGQTRTGRGVFLDQYVAYTESLARQDIFRQVAHSLHFISIAILGFLVLEDLVRIIALGRCICRHKIEIFDAMVIGTSFTVDIIYLGGVSGDDGQQAAAALVVLLVWRVARVVDGIIVTVKQRQEFRIRLQRRARRKAERKLELAEEERQKRIRQLDALLNLCSRAGVKQEDIAAICISKNPKRLSRMFHALSSVARLSVGMTMCPHPISRQTLHQSDWCLNTYSDHHHHRRDRHHPKPLFRRDPDGPQGPPGEGDGEGQDGGRSNVIIVVPEVLERCNSDVDLTSYRRHKQRCAGLAPSLAQILQRLEMRVSRSTEDLSVTSRCRRDDDDDVTFDAEDDRESEKSLMVTSSGFAACEKRLSCS